MSHVPVIAIFDIGKTNKKFFLLDQQYSIVLERTVQFAEIKDEDGDGCEDIKAVSKWIRESLDEILLLEQYEVKAVNFSAYGASLVYIDEKGEIIAPLYNYLKPFPKILEEKFYSKHGNSEQIALETCSPILQSLNAGLQLYRFAEEKPSLYHELAFALHLPQYFSFLISGVPCSDLTSIGCHTMLWNFEHKQYHQWVKEEGLDKKLAPVLRAEKTIKSIYHNREIKSGTGLHDSSAALIPYLTVFTEQFILLSTGTWCISLNPFNDRPLTAEELQQDCLCYLEFQGRPVKASRLFAGYEHEQEVKRISEYYGIKTDFFKDLKFDAAIYHSVEDKKMKLATADTKNNNLRASVFSQRDLSAFDTAVEAYHCLIADIIAQQYQSTQLVLGGTAVNRIFVDGGFSNNSIYMHLLAIAFPALEVYAASVAQATAMGAALAIHQEWNPNPVPADMVKLKFYKAIETLQHNR